MIRIFIFPLLMPQFALFVLVVPGILKDGFPRADFWGVAETFAYIIVIIPAFFSAAVDWVLFKQQRYLRLGITACAAGAFALVWAHYIGARPSANLVSYASLGAIPAALCSWISTRIEHKESEATGS